MTGAPHAYYNEHDPFAAAWLRELISKGAIAPGHVDERSIHDVHPADFAGFTQCHFFAGIGGWSLALRLAGWDDGRPVWTGSCPCQPFSAAGRGAGMSDDRHLWPVFYDLIRACRPPVVFGEQVASAAVVGGAKPLAGPAWLDVVFADLEAAHYACGAADIPAAGVGAPHIRQRLWWVGVADSDSAGRQPRQNVGGSEGPRDGAGWPWDQRQLSASGVHERLADSLGPRLEGRDSRALGHEREAPERGGAAGGLGVAASGGRAGLGPEPEYGESGSSGASPWSDLEWLPCRDGKTRPTQPGLFPLAHGIRNRVGLLRGAGNAIVPQAGAAWVETVRSVLDAA